MWRCSNCHESVDDTFAICWNCGAAADGTLDSDFTPEPDDPAVRDPGEDADSEAAPDQLDAPPQSLCSGGMNRQEIAALICKTLALILFAVAAVLSMTAAFLLGFVLITAPYGHPSNPQDLFVFLVAAVPVLTMVGVGAFYWKKSKSIASLMVSADPRPVAFQVFTVQDAMTVAFSTAGLFFFLAGVRDIVRVVYIVQRYSTGDSDSGYGFQMLLAVIQLTLAIWLILGSRGIVGAIHWCRTAGIPQPEDEPQGPNGE